MAGAQQISDTLTQLSEAAQQTAESLRQSNLAIEQLNSAARGLQTAFPQVQDSRDEFANYLNVLQNGGFAFGLTVAELPDELDKDQVFLD